MEDLRITAKNRRYFRLLLMVAGYRSRSLRIRIARGSKLLAANVELGRGTRINGPCIAKGTGDLKVGRYCAIGDGVKFITSNHGTSGLNLNLSLQRRLGVPPLVESPRGIRVGHNVWIGDNVIVLAGVEVGNGCVIGAGAVVTRSVEPYSICVGNPGRTVRKRFGEAVEEAIERSCWWERDENGLAQVRQLFARPDLSADEAEVLRELRKLAGSP